MRKIMNVLCLFLILSFFCLCSEAKAESSRWYFGVNAGVSEVEVVGHDRSDLVAKALQKKGLTVSASSGAQNDDDHVYSLLAGYRFHRYGAIEAQVLDMGEVDGTFNATVGVDTLSGKIDSEYRAASLSLLGYLPLFSRVDLIGRAGVHYWEHEFELKTRASSNPGYVGQSSTVDDDGIDLVYGVGVQVMILKKLSARLEWTRFQGIEDEDGIDSKSISVLYTF